MRSHPLAGAWLYALAPSALLAANHAAYAQIGDTPAPTVATQPAATDQLQTITVTAHHLDEARTGIGTQTGTSTYTIDAAAIQAAPGGDNAPLNDVILQAPGVAQDSFGQIHVRGEHNGLQYRLNGIILPEGISVFGQTLDPRLISSMKLITGTLPAQYGLRTAGIIDLTTRSGMQQPGGLVSLYGGSHDTLAPSINYGGSDGRLNYFVSADMLRNALGIESPDSMPVPPHDHTTQYHGFGYFEYILDDSDRLSAVLGTSDDRFQIPDRSGLQPSLGLTVDGQSTYPSAALNENQVELTHYGILSLQHSQGNLDLQTSFTSRYSSLGYTPDELGDLLYNGIAQQAFKRDMAYGLQTDGAWNGVDSHTIRAGLYLQRDRALSDTSSQVLLMNDSAEISDVPVTIVDNGGHTQWLESAYLQDEWKLQSAWTLNYGLRYDHYSAYDSEQQLSPRINLLWQAATNTQLHAGYSRYFSPPPFELVGGQMLAQFIGTSAAPLSDRDATVRAERANYYDVGAQQDFGHGLVLGLDTYYKLSRNLLDEGQFGAPIILTPFNYRYGKQYGTELTANYSRHGFTAYGNLAWEHALGKDIVSSQFNFDQADLDYIANHYIHLDHEQQVTASAGVSYTWNGTTLSTDMMLGSGLRADEALPDGSDIPNGTHLPYYTTVNVGASHGFGAGFTGRVDVINVLDRVYEIRNGTGVGVGAPQFGAPRGVFFGLSKTL